MIDIILSALAENNISVYCIFEDKTDTAELFFVKKQLDMRRTSNVHSYTVSVYNDFEKDGVKMRGTTNVSIHPSMSKEEVSKVLNEAYFAASFVCNKYYALTDGIKEATVIKESSLSSLSLDDAATKAVEALYEADKKSDTWINSAEIFVNKTFRRIISSEGTDVSYIMYKLNGEFVTQCTTPSDVELYTDFAYDELACEALTKKASEALNTVKARASAAAAPAAGTYDIILSGKHVHEILSYYTLRSNAAYVYPKYSNYKIGDDIQGESVQGEKLTITLSSSVPYTDTGIAMKDRLLLEDGNLKLIHGGTRFCRYIDVEPTGIYNKIICSNGTVPFEQMKKQPYLYIVNFSDFQMDPFSGHFGGEIRLAYLFDGTETKVVTGGSINGSILEAQNNFVFSTDRYTDMNYNGPFAVKITNVNVAGV